MTLSALPEPDSYSGPPINHIGWGQHGEVRFLDQTKLPQQQVYCETSDIEELVEAIRSLRVRGAPLIGVTAAMGLASASAIEAGKRRLTRLWFDKAADRLAAARPTGVNLAWAIDRMRTVGGRAFEEGGDGTTVAAALRDEAQAIWDEDIAMCLAIGAAGANLVPESATLLTHCNAGALATGGSGTALAVIYRAHADGKQPRVYATETRPLRQGARLTAWELQRAGVPVTSIVDSAVASLMADGTVDLVITGADRITANGDVANKIGTYGLAVLAEAHSIPFYVAAPFSTFDLSLETGAEILIEERSAAELEAAPGSEVRNPAFDVTPNRLVTALVSDRGVLEPPFLESIARASRDDRSSSSQQ